MTRTQQTKGLQRIEQLIIRHPILFGFILFLLFTILATLTWPITQFYPYPEGSGLGEALAKLIMSACFVGLLWRLGWMDFAGYRRFGRKLVWLVVIPLILFKVFLGVYVFTGSFSFRFPAIADSLGIIFFALATSLLEESMYRGLLLTAMRKAWGNSQHGILLSAALSGLFFACLHFFNLLVHPFPVVSLQVLSLILTGFYYAIFAICGASIWPAVAFHWLTNATITLALTNITDFSETITNWVGYSAIALVPVLISVLLLKRTAERSSALDTGIAAETRLID